MKAYPDMQGIIFDQPETAQRAQDHIRDAGLADRCTTVGGDFFKAETLPDNGDAYMMRNIMHNWGDEPCEKILTNIAARMPDDARVLVMEQPLALAGAEAQRLPGILGRHAGMVGYVDVPVVRGTRTHRRGFRSALQESGSQ